MSAVASVAHSAERSPVPPSFDALVADVQTTWNMPGVAVAIVQDGQIAFAKGYGVREVGRAERVDADTVFGIASVTKLLVTTAIATLVEQGTLKLDARVVDYLPGFRVADPYVTAHLTVRDLLSHRSGLNFDDTFIDIAEQLGSIDSSALVQRSQFVGQSFSLRERWQYNNFGFLIAAEVITRVSGMPWYDYIRQRVAAPLQMRNTWARSLDFLPRTHVLPTGDGWSEIIPRGIAALPATLNIATPHLMWPKTTPQLAYESKELTRKTAHFHRSAIDPCQSAWSSALDLARFAAMWMNAGQHEQVSLISPKVVDDVFNLAVTIRQGWPAERGGQQPDDSFDQFRRQVAQASGFAVYDYAGRVQYGHDGWELGYQTLVRLDPEAKIAVVVLVNNALYEEGEFATGILARSIFDWHYGRPAADHSALFDGYVSLHAQRIRRHQDRMSRLDAQRDRSAKPTVPLASFAGTYEHPFLGELIVSVRNEKLVASLDSTAQWILTASHGNVFDGDWQGALIGRKTFAFDVGADAKVQGFTLPGDNLTYRRRR